MNRRLLQIIPAHPGTTAEFARDSGWSVSRVVAWGLFEDVDSGMRTVAGLAAGMRKVEPVDEDDDFHGYSTDSLRPDPEQLEASREVLPHLRDYERLVDRLKGEVRRLRGEGPSLGTSSDC